tara:strand:+ start:49442 stop:50653 length:1212 start_codon:yes stop_codon:yes gene_type:complete
MKKQLIIAGLFLGGMTFTSCSSDDTPLDDNQVEIPQNYSFSRSGSTTVSFSGQTTRILMVKEMSSAFLDFENTTEASLSNMFSNQNSPFSSADLNQSDKSVKSKTAASEDYFSTNSVESNSIKADFESFISGQFNEVVPNENILASAGVAGQIADGSSVRYVNSQGLEYNQAFAKGLIGALLTDQILNNYLSPLVLDSGDNVLLNNAGTVEEGKNYTTMEHKWDEAYGYLYGDPSIPEADPNSALSSNNDKLLFNYLAKVNEDPDFAGIADALFNAFITGRAAIVAKNYEVRDQQIAIIKENISKVIAIRAVYYLQKGKTAMAEGNLGDAFHQLSEGYGFIYSLRFTQNPDTDLPYFSTSQIEDFKNQLLNGNGFWDVTPTTLDSISAEIAAAFGFSVEQAAP